MESLPQDWLALIGSIAFVMVLVKAGMKNALPLLAKRVAILNSDEAEIKATFTVIAGIIGIALAFTVYKDTSYFAEFDFIPTESWLDFVDHIMVGVFASLGQKFAADAFDRGKDIIGIIQGGSDAPPVA